VNYNIFTIQFQIAVHIFMQYSEIQLWRLV